MGLETKLLRWGSIIGTEILSFAYFYNYSAPEFKQDFGLLVPLTFATVFATTLYMITRPSEHKTYSKEPDNDYEIHE